VRYRLSETAITFLNLNASTFELYLIIILNIIQYVNKITKVNFNTNTEIPAFFAFNCFYSYDILYMLSRNSRTIVKIGYLLSQYYAV